MLFLKLNNKLNKLNNELKFSLMLAICLILYAIYPAIEETTKFWWNAWLGMTWLLGQMLMGLNC